MDGLRALGGGVLVKRGRFGRPIVKDSYCDFSQADDSFEFLRTINENRLDIRSGVVPGKASYFILVPTLRCNISCAYCQVSRVNEAAKGYDWNDGLVEDVVKFITKYGSTHVTLEFQGGEPLLRLDLIREITEKLSGLGRTLRVVICTNLQNVSREALDFMANDNVQVSTSFDGTWDSHKEYRLPKSGDLEKFKINLINVIKTLGHERVSLTSTFDPLRPPDPPKVFAAMQDLGVSMMFIRPINYQGFARKSFKSSQNDQTWDEYYQSFIQSLIQFNINNRRNLSEYYFSYLVRRVLDPRRSEHVDLRNPALLAKDYYVINEVGDVFPTDEARMLYRSGQIDLRVGHVSHGLNEEFIKDLNECSDNRDDPDCCRCVYQSVCGRDIIDDISRYGRIDTPRLTTRHCQKHMAIFDFIMRTLATSSEHELDVLSKMVGLEKIDPASFRKKNV